MVVAYLRVSTGKQCLENQQGEISRFAQIKDIKVDCWITEVVSGKTSSENRKLGELLRGLGKGDVLVVTEVSRLSRSFHEIMEIMWLCLKKGVTIYSVKDGYAFDDSINSKVMSFVFGLVAELERNLISQRTKEALAVRKARGRRLGRKPGTDYKMKTLEKSLDKIVLRIQRGHSIVKICSEFGVSVQTFRNYRLSNDRITEAIDKRKEQRR